MATEHPALAAASQDPMSLTSALRPPALGRRALQWLGLQQLLLWGLLYYSFALLLVPVEQEFALARDQVALAFSLGLVMSALASTWFGRWVDRGRGERVLQVGALLAVLGLVAAALSSSLLEFYLAWALIGLGMAGLLYDPVFAMLLRRTEPGQQRLHALATVSIYGGLASTVCVPSMAMLFALLGWREALLVFAATVLAVAWAVQRWVLPELLNCAVIGSAPLNPVPLDSMPQPGPVLAPKTADNPARGIDFWLLNLLFAFSILSAAALTTLIVPIMVDRGQMELGVLVLSAWGLLQLPGRIWMLRPRAQDGIALLVLPLLLQILALLVLALSTHALLMALAVAIFALGAGLQTLARPLWVGRCFSAAAAGRVTGRMSRWSGMFRALGPWLGAWLYVRGGEPLTFTVLAALLALLVPALGLWLRARVGPSRSWGGAG